jgi:hypothetical protein
VTTASVRHRIRTALPSDFTAAAQDLCESLGFRPTRELDWEFEPGEWPFANRLDR